MPLVSCQKSLLSLLTSYSYCVCPKSSYFCLFCHYLSLKAEILNKITTTTTFHYSIFCIIYFYDKTYHLHKKKGHVIL